MPTTLPRYAHDIYSDAAIIDPYPHYRAIRDLGPVVALPGVDVLAVARYADVLDVLSHPEIFLSGKGVAVSEIMNQIVHGGILTSDGELHDQLRGLMAHRLTPRALRGERDGIEATARAVVDQILERDTVDGVRDVARAVPMAVIPNYIGFPEECHDQLIGWAQSAIEASGPESARTPAAVQGVGGLNEYAAKVVYGREPREGSLADDLLHAADRGEVAMDKCPVLMLDYFVPSMETTISAISSALALFAANPDQWDLLRADPSLLGGVFNEVVRLESPLRALTRYVNEDTEIGGVPVAAGSRVLLVYASANRDERRWDDPDRFDITRDNAEHLGLGHGVHGCAGQGMARLEFFGLFGELAARVSRIEFAGEPQRLLNSVARGFDTLPLRLVADRS